MADDTVNVRFTADAGGLVTAKTGFRDIVAEMEAFEASSNSMTNATNGVSEGMKGLALSTVGAKREVIVLGHELLTGNLSRVPGSLLVLAERMGGLSTSFLVGAGAAAAFGYALFEVISSGEETIETLNQIDAALKVQGKGGFDDANLKQYIDELAKLPGVSHAAAEAIIRDLVEAPNISEASFQKLRTIITDYGEATHEDAEKVSEDLIKMSNDPAKAAIQLAATYKGILTPSQFEAIQNFQALGDKMSAMGVLSDALKEHFHDLQSGALSPLEIAANGVSRAFSFMGNVLGAVLGIGGSLEKLFPVLASSMKELEDATGDSGAKSGANVQQQLNDQIVKGLELEKQVGGKLQEQLKLQQEIAQLKSARGAAIASGDSADADKLLQTQIELQEKLNKLQQPDNSGAAADLSAKRQMAEEEYQIQTSYNQLAFESGKITKQEEVNADKEALAQMNAVQQASFNASLALYQNDEKNYQKILDQKKLAEQKYQLEVVKLDQQAEKQKEQIQKEAETKLKSSLNEITTAFNQQATLIITGQEKIGQGFLKLAGTLITSMIEAFLQIGEKWVATQLLELVTGEATTDAIIAGHAGEAYAAAYASTAAIPIIGPIIAPDVATSAGLAAASGGLALASFDVGTNYVPSDGVAMIHQGERIIPKADNAKLMDSLDKGGGGGDTHAHFHFHTLDTQGVASMIKRNSGALTKGIAGAARGGSGALRSAAAKL